MTPLLHQQQPRQGSSLRQRVALMKRVKNTGWGVILKQWRRFLCVFDTRKCYMDGLDGRMDLFALTDASICQAAIARLPALSDPYFIRSYFLWQSLSVSFLLFFLSPRDPLFLSLRSCLFYPHHPFIHSSVSVIGASRHRWLTPDPSARPFSLLAAPFPDLLHQNSFCCI